MKQQTERNELQKGAPLGEKKRDRVYDDSRVRVQ